MLSYADRHRSYIDLSNHRHSLLIETVRKRLKCTEKLVNVAEYWVLGSPHLRDLVHRANLDFQLDFQISRRISMFDGRSFSIKRHTPLPYY